jgi:hypothetical protein
VLGKSLPKAWPRKRFISKVKGLGLPVGERGVDMRN